MDAQQFIHTYYAAIGQRTRKPTEADFKAAHMILERHGDLITNLIIRAVVRHANSSDLPVIDLESAIDIFAIVVRQAQDRVMSNEQSKQEKQKRTREDEDTRLRQQRDQKAFDDLTRRQQNEVLDRVWKMVPPDIPKTFRDRLACKLAWEMKNNGHTD